MRKSSKGLMTRGSGERQPDRLLPMSLELFERECVRLLDSIPRDDPLADLDVRGFAENALRLVREFIDYRAKVAALERERDELKAKLEARRNERPTLQPTRLDLGL